MTDPTAASAAQLANIEKSTGLSLQEWAERLAATGLDKHGQILAHLKTEYGLSHGNANGLALRVREVWSGPTTDADLVAAQYAGPKAPLLAIHDRLVAVAVSFGPDVGVAVKKTGVSLRRSKQFALIEPKSAKRVQLGINLKGAEGTERLKVAGGMCTHLVNLSDADEVDGEVVDWLRAAYDRA